MSSTIKICPKVLLRPILAVLSLACPKGNCKRGAFVKGFILKTKGTDTWAAYLSTDGNPYHCEIVSMLPSFQAALKALRVMWLGK